MDEKHFECIKCKKRSPFLTKPLLRSSIFSKERVEDSFVLLNSYPKPTRNPFDLANNHKKVTVISNLQQYFNNPQKKPICVDCIEKLFEMLNKEVTQLEDEKKQYEDLLRSLDGDIESDEFEKEMKKLEEEEAQLRNKLTELEEEKIVLQAQKQSLEKEQKSLTMKAEKYWFVYNDTQIQNKELREEKLSLERRLRFLLLNKETLNTLPTDSAFHIWYEGKFGTINGLRLGRYKDHLVSWEEINAAWGLAALLLYLIARRKNFTFSMYRIIPMGSTSKVEHVHSGNKFDLYLTSIRYASSFNNAMIGFLNCVQELCNYVRKKEPAIKLDPYIPIDDNKIGGIAIEYQSTEEDELRWTKACKRLLINLKFLQKSKDS